LSFSYPSLNTWHHIAATYDGANIKLYLDGSLVATKPQTGAITTNTNILGLGNQPGYNEYFGGTVDELRLWNVARTVQEINATKGMELTGAETGLIAYYNFNQGVPVSDNTTVLSIQNMLPTGDANLSGFALNGTASNFVDGNTFGINSAVVQSGISLIAQNISATYQWLNCNTNQLIPGAINQSYTPNVNGNYAALITQCGISDTSDCFTINTVGLDELKMVSEMIMFPNPATSSFTIKLPTSKEFIQVRIFNMIGELVSNKLYNGNHIIVNDISNLSSGSYTVEVQSESRSWKKKLVILQ
jgi:hypothetical protein